MSDCRWRRWIRPPVTPFVLAALVLAGWVPSFSRAQAAPGAEPKQTSPLTALRRAAPRVLTGEDAALYRRIFAAQRGGHWAQADVMAAQLNDRLLMGHVLHQRYLAPSYRAKYAELRDWMIHYRDQPGADQIYQLAQARAPKRAATPKPGVLQAVPAGGGIPDDFYPSAKSAAGLRWRAGLDAWAAGQHEAAAKAFTAVARARHLSGAMESAAAFWAGRAEARLGHADLARRWYETAAERPMTFYGLLAAAQLGRGDGLQWRKPVLTEANLSRLRRNAGVRRTIALVQIGQPHLAEREMDAVYARKVARSGTLLALASSLGLPQAQLRISSDMSAPGAGLSTALYPLPFWTPTGGFRVDPAFLFALMRQESGFDAYARSSAGARGLMQLMPATARTIAAQHLDGEDDALFNPIINLTLGQRYIETLQAELGAQADPLTLAIAYNMGPTSLRKWRRKMGKGADPLLFIESIGSLQTKLHAKRVLANFWIYRARFQRQPGSLQTMAAGEWPAPLSKDFPERGQALASIE